MKFDQIAGYDGSNYNQLYSGYGAGVQSPYYGYNTGSLGTGGYGTAGYGTAGYGTAGYGTAGYGTTGTGAYGSGYVYNRPLNNQLTYPNTNYYGYTDKYNSGYNGIYNSNRYNNLNDYNSAYRYNNYNGYNGYTGNNANTGYNGYNSFSNYYPSSRVIGLPYNQQAYSQQYNSDGYVY